MGKTKYEVYEIGSKVWAISQFYKDGKPSEYLAIFPAIIKDATIEAGKLPNTISVSYWLSTLEGKEWGDSVDEIDVSDDFYVLVDKAKKIWENSSNNF